MICDQCGQDHPDEEMELTFRLRLTGPTTRPEVVLDASPHAIYREQSQGIDAHRIAEYTALFA